MNQKSKIKWTSYLATAFAEGFAEGEGATNEEQIEAWAYLIKTGQVWKLQGWFGRAAKTLIQQKIVEEDGTINWDIYNEINGIIEEEE